MKRIPLHETILQIITANMRIENYLQWDLKACEITKFIGNNYRRRKYKTIKKNDLKTERFKIGDKVKWIPTGAIGTIKGRCKSFKDSYDLGVINGFSYNSCYEGNLELLKKG